MTGAPRDSIPVGSAEAEVGGRTARWLRLLDEANDFIRENLGLLLTLGYIYLTGIGMAYQARFYRSFGVNIFDFTDAADFLLAGVRDPLIVLMSLVPFPLAWLYISLVQVGAEVARRRLNQPPPRRDGLLGHTLMKRLGVGMMLFTWVLAFVSGYGRQTARQLLLGKGRRVTVETTGPGDSLATRDATLLGTTARYVFLFDAASNRTEIIPVENVRRLTLATPPPKRPRATR